MTSAFKPLEVLFEDNHLIAVKKNPSDLVQGDKTGDQPLSEIVQTYLKKKYDKPGNVFIGVTHRIDRPVSGTLLFAKTSKALARLNKAFQAGEIKKTYWAVVGKEPPQKAGNLVDHLKKIERLNRSVVTDAKDKWSKRAELNYEFIGSGERYHFLVVHPQTGRHHQIRVQLSHMGCPIKGDLKYGAPRSNKNASIHLHAHNITFTHPVSGEQISINCPPPQDNLWQEFEEQYKIFAKALR